MNNIEATTEYDSFSFIPGNRDTNKNHLEHLIESISKHNMLANFPIIVNENREVIDGQHRLLAAQQLKVPIYYKIVIGLTLDDAILANSNNKNWTVTDYIRSHVKKANEHYQNLMEFTTNYKLPVTVSIMLLLGKNTREGIDMHDLRQGRFEIKDMDGAASFATYLHDIKPYTEGAVWKSRDFIRALRIAVKIKSQSFVLKKFKARGKKLRRHATVNDYLRELESMVNFKVSEENKVRLF